MDTKDAESFWGTLEVDSDACDTESFVTTLAEAWDCPDSAIGLITKELIRTVRARFMLKSNHQAL